MRVWTMSGQGGNLDLRPRLRRIAGPSASALSRIRIVVLVLGALLAAASARAAAPIDAVLAPYLRIQAQLADDKSDALKADADAMAEAAASLGTAGAPLASAARELSTASGLAAVRDAFGKVSDALIAYVDGSQAAVGADTARVYCPMARRSWLQTGDAIRNPYFGKGMLGCGVIKKRG
jgi:Cu(I)/Ag(I) efflux system membrane fusion protein